MRMLEIVAVLGIVLIISGLVAVATSELSLVKMKGVVLVIIGVLLVMPIISLILERGRRG